jgi:hypothetical protein
MNRIVREHYPVERLPEDLREGIPAGEQVTVVVEIEHPHSVGAVSSELRPPEKVLSLDEIFALRTPPFRSADEINDALRRDRDEWE